MTFLSSISALWAVTAPLASAVTAHHVRLQGESLVTLPMHQYKQDCWKKRPVSLMQNSIRIPGAGMTPEALEPFATVLKDGFFQVDCVKDYMLAHGDKFGKNKFSYELGEVSNVSIVRYTELVPAEDQESMTHATCFAFCRTVPNMLFFGISNGRDCYCAPYYKPMADDDAMCDLVCDGDKTTMCGGKSKSSIFEMHMCTNTKADLEDAHTKMTGLDAEMMALHSEVSGVAVEMQSTATVLQQSFGNAGDPVASDLMQSAKKFAGDMEQTSREAETLSGEMDLLAADFSGMAAIVDFSDFETAENAEKLIQKMETAAAETEVKIEELEAFSSKYNPSNGSVVNVSQQYYPVMYFVDKSFDSVPSTCGGTAATTPLIVSMDGCAATCDATANCVGFSYFPDASLQGKGICFPFSKLTSATYYTACTQGAFLQRVMKVSQAVETHCMAKLSRFEGTTLKPDPSGKCKQCLTAATNAARCFS